MEPQWTRMDVGHAEVIVCLGGYKRELNETVGDVLVRCWSSRANETRPRLHSLASKARPLYTQVWSTTSHLRQMDADPAKA